MQDEFCFGRMFCLHPKSGAAPACRGKGAFLLYHDARKSRVSIPRMHKHPKDGYPDRKVHRQKRAHIGKSRRRYLLLLTLLLLLFEKLQILSCGVGSILHLGGFFGAYASHLGEEGCHVLLVQLSLARALAVVKDG